jgi:hypothetical protein
MRNHIHQKLDPLLMQARRCADGAAEYGTQLTLTYNTATVIRQDITNLEVACRNYIGAKIALSNLYKDQKPAVATAKQRLTLAREILKLRFGTSYSQAWDETAWRGSLAIPANVARVMTLVRGMETFFRKHPDMEHPTLEMTAQHFGALLQTLVNFDNDIRTKKANLDRSLLARNQAARKLRRRIRGLINELNEVVDENSTIYLSFGLNIPGAKARPQKPQNIQIGLRDEKMMQVKWDREPGVEYYRVWKRDAAENAEFVVIGSSKDTSFVMEISAVNTDFDLAVTSVNERGESGLSKILRVKRGQEQNLSPG